jgi:hypothetical protein
MEASGAALLTDADDAPPGAPGRYERHRPEQTLLYQIIAQHYPAFLARLAAEGRTLPLFVRREFEAYFKCGLLKTASKKRPPGRCAARTLVSNFAYCLVCQIDRGSIHPIRFLTGHNFRALTAPATLIDRSILQSETNTNDERQGFLHIDVATYSDTPVTNLSLTSFASTGTFHASFKAKGILPSRQATECFETQTPKAAAISLSA